MLKIALVRWKGKCSRHPRFNPDTDGEGAIHGNCPRCQQLQAIYENHSRTLKLIRAFRPPTPENNSGREPSVPNRQQLILFDDPQSNPNRPATENGE